MNIETIKTFILAALVGISLLLTFSLWNYQPNAEYLANEKNEYVNEVDLGGSEESKKTIIEPQAIIFHKDDNYLGFSDPTQRQKLYKDMQDWMLDDYILTSAQGKPTNNYQIEMIFPTSLPIDIIKSLFTFNEEEDALPSWLFKRIFITLSPENSILQVAILSVDESQQINYTVKDSSIYNKLWAYFTMEMNLSEYILFDQGTEPIYLPTDSLDIKNQSFTVQTIDSYLLVNALFSNPSNVSPNIGEAYFTDGQRGMRILNEGRSMEFINPIHSNGERMDPSILLDRSLSNINEHKGWTNKFTLVDINIYNNKLHYRMQYEGYPVFSPTTMDGDLAVIEQQWLNQDLHLYKRPLFSLDNLLGGDTTTIPSGNDIISYIENNEHYDQEKISDIQVGFKLTYLESTSYSLTLNPTWYMKYNGNWLEIKLEEYDTFKGVD